MTYTCSTQATMEAHRPAVPEGTQINDLHMFHVRPLRSGVRNPDALPIFK